MNKMVLTPDSLTLALSNKPDFVTQSFELLDTDYEDNETTETGLAKRTTFYNTLFIEYQEIYTFIKGEPESFCNFKNSVFWANNWNINNQIYTSVKDSEIVKILDSAPFLSRINYANIKSRI